MRSRKARKPAADKAARRPSAVSAAGELKDREAKPRTSELQARADARPVDRVLQGYATELRTLARKSVQDVIAIGKLLTKAQKRLGHGNWLPWLGAELGWSDDSARNYMAVYRLSLQPKFRKFRHFWHRVAPSVLYMLARQGLSDETFDEVMQRIASGEKITPAAAKKFVTVTVTHTGQRVWPIDREDSELPTSSPPDRGLPFALFPSRGGTSVPSTATEVPSEPPLLQIPAPTPPVRDQDLPQVDIHRMNQEREFHTPEINLYEAGRQGTARAVARDLHDLSRYTDRCEPKVLEAVREILLADPEKLARVRSVIDLVIRLKGVLDRASAAPKTANLRLIADDPETPR